jgi:hypothetical protein
VPALPTRDEGTSEGEGPPAAETEGDADGADAAPTEGAEVVSLDAFRKKP